MPSKVVCCSEPVTWNDPDLAQQMAPSLERVAGARFNPNGQPYIV